MSGNELHVPYTVTGVASHLASWIRQVAGVLNRIINEAAAAGGTAAWGGITGTLSAQTDLQTALDAKQPLDSDLTALAGNSTNGLWARTGTGTGAARTLTPGSAKISVTFGNGVSGNPTVDLGSVASTDLSDSAGLARLAGGTFTGDISVPDEAYDATAWNGSMEVPTKNAIRDKIETMGGTGTVTNVATDDTYVSGGPITSTGTISATTTTKSAVDSALHAMCGGI